jgi:hypothetical protein
MGRKIARGQEACTIPAANPYFPTTQRADPMTDRRATPERSLFPGEYNV